MHFDEGILSEGGQGSGCVASPLVNLSNLLTIGADRVDQLVVGGIQLDIRPLLFANSVVTTRIVPVNHDLIV